MTDYVWVGRATLDLQLERIRSVHEIAEHAARQHDSRVDEWYQEQHIAADDDGSIQDRQYLENLFLEQKIEAQEYYPQVLRSSVFIAAYAVFEHFMIALCREAAKHLGGVSVADLRGEGVGRARLYITKVARVAYPDTEQWRNLDDFRLLRNTLVHAQGAVSDNAVAARLRALGERTGTFTVEPDLSGVSLTSELTPRFCEDALAFADQLHRAWR